MRKCTEAADDGMQKCNSSADYATLMCTRTAGDIMQECNGITEYRMQNCYVGDFDISHKSSCSSAEVFHAYWEYYWSAMIFIVNDSISAYCKGEYPALF